MSHRVSTLHAHIIRQHSKATRAPFLELHVQYALGIDDGTCAVPLVHLWSSLLQVAAKPALSYNTGVSHWYQHVTECEKAAHANMQCCKNVHAGIARWQAAGKLSQPDLRP